MNQSVISSIKDPRIILTRELTTRAGRLKHSQMLLYGEDQITWALDRGVKIEYILCLSKEALDDSITESILCYEVTEGVLKKATETNYVIPCVAIAYFPAAVLQDQEFTVVLDNVVDFGNIGTIIRTAQSFGIRNFIATSHEFDPFQRKVIDASRGSVFQSSFCAQKNPTETVRFLKEQGYQIVVTSPHASHLQSQAPLEKKPVALVVGNESEGVCEEIIKHADVMLQIPMNLHVESLNVGVATGISVYELKFRMALLMLRENIFQTIGRQINVAGKLVQMVFDTKIKKITGLTGQQVILLMICECDGKMTAQQVAQDVGAHGPGLVTFLQPLQDKNLLKESDGFFQLTEEGQRFLAQVWPVVEQTNQEILIDFSEDEKMQLNAFLVRIERSCTALLGDTLR